MIFVFVDEDVAVAVVNPAINTLLVLNVLPEHRSHGLGSAILRYLQCNFARVVEGAIPFFRAKRLSVRGRYASREKTENASDDKKQSDPTCGKSG